MRNLLAALGLSAILLASRAEALDVAFENDSSLPLVRVSVVIRSGSVLDPSGQSGITNFLGEMLLRGTRARTKEQIDLELDRLGGEIGVETRAEALIFRASVLSANVAPFLDLFTEILTQPRFADDEIRKLKAEVTSRIAQELGRDMSLASRRFVEFLFAGHPYGKPVLGTTRDVTAFAADSIREHYSRTFREKALLVVGSGDVPAFVVRSWAAAVASARTGGEAPPLVSAPEAPRGPRVRVLDKPDRTQTQVRMGHVGVRMTDPDFFPLYVANHAFGGGTFSARLMVELRVKRGWTYGANSSFVHGRRPRLWQIGFFPAEKDTPAAVEYALGMVRELKAKGLSADEFAFAKRSLVNGAGFMYNTPDKRVENRLLELMLDLPEGFMKTYADGIQEVTLDDSNGALGRFIAPENLSILVLGTASHIRESVAKAAGVDSGAVEVVDYKRE